MRSKRFEALAKRPVNQDGFVKEWIEEGFIAMESPNDPKPLIKIVNGVVTELDGKPASQFDLIDHFIARYGINLARAEEVIAMDSVKLANMLCDPNVKRSDIVPLTTAMTPAKIVEVVSQMNVVEMMMAMQKMRARRTPSQQAHVTNVKDADAIMKAVGECPKLENVTGEPGTNIGGMLEHVRQTMAELTNKPSNEIFIQDLLAIDTSVPVSVTGGLAGEFSLEQAVGIASMVKSDRLQMAMIASEIKQKLHVDVQVGGAEAEAAIQGALTTPGTTRPLAILDLGAGSTDASIINQSGEIVATHLAGAGDMVTMIIARELGLNDRYLAEEIKKYPLAKVESLFHLRHEDGSVQFFPTPLSPHVFARVCVVKPDELVPIPGDLTQEKVRAVRRSAKERVFVTNALRALRQVSPGGNIRDIPFVVLVGGSSLDFEVPQLVTDALAHYRLVAGRGNIRGSEGPRNAVATGLLISWHRELAHGK
ncbi:diol dehydratase reactivase subunit alpha [Escherichia coli]|uniref:diol dehydratase reactivase subunit alpha n=1 Tax=Escherichia coli TaxID=562 RepID=UPI000BDFA1DB|nr:diol dehydratase reactivase subunit alpha [Escherichia coli]EFA8814054.1 diol dehydratase reactivase subunit alpha [Escherichia coli O74]EFH4246617.1 diol dehydratase reactivase subunit alpha [Escherichia coli]EFN0006330.1 diol dehydratase reactivase subunit alpha [Escherichia coli]EIA8220828.1 diol dehydratase reactivase subunit alpha [Escherichia coli]EJH3463915.1 diol dehydratase reactivase subunit alpha [Escherichia coli]